MPDSSSRPDSDSLARLQLDWRDAGARLGLPTKSRAWESIYHDLVQRHSAETRHYHGIEHVAAVLRAIVELTGDLDPILVATTFFHDAVYDPKRPDNEAQSAELARAVLPGARLTEAPIAAITQIIEATATHQMPDSPLTPDLCAAFLDADLSILGAFPDKYSWYTKAIRAEYSHLDDETFRAGRSNVLQSFLDRDVLFFTDAGRTAWESSARRNLARELSALQRPSALSD